MIREVVFGVGFALFLPLFYGLNGVLYSMPVSDILTFAASLFVLYKTYRELNGKIAVMHAAAKKTPESLVYNTRAAQA